MKTILITGATSGIGKALARQFVDAGYSLILHGRDQKKLDDVMLEIREKNISSTIISDLSKPEGSQIIIDAIKKNNIVVDILINNAGFGLYGEFIETNFKKEEEMIAVNVTSLVHLSKYFLQEMKKNKSGHIINIASVAAFEPGPYMSVYFATKAFVLHFTEAIAAEAKNYGVTIQAICPGAVNTGFQKTSKTDRLKIMEKKSAALPEDLATFIFKNLDSKKVVLVFGFKNKLMTLLPRIFPRKLVRGVMRKVMGEGLES